MSLADGSTDDHALPRSTRGGLRSEVTFEKLFNRKSFIFAFVGFYHLFLLEWRNSRIESIYGSIFRGLSTETLKIEI